jgi:hypothetical protein
MQWSFGLEVTEQRQPQRRTERFYGLRRSSAALVVVKLIFRQVGPAAAALFCLIAKTARLKEQRPLLCSVLEPLPLPIELCSLALEFIPLCSELRNELFSFLSFHRFVLSRVTDPPLAAPVYRAALNIIIADVGSMGKRRATILKGARLPGGDGSFQILSHLVRQPGNWEHPCLSQPSRRDLKGAQPCAMIEDL